MLTKIWRKIYKLVLCLQLMNRSGQGDITLFYWILGVIGFMFIAFLLIQFNAFSLLSSKFVVNLDSVGFDTVFGSEWAWLNYIFGKVPSWLPGVSDGTGRSAAIIVLATFFLILVTFGDVLQSFSTFSRPVSWIVAVLMTIIAANMKAVVAVLGLFIGIFSFLGGLSVLVGLLSAFVAFIAVNWGIGSLGPWIIRRRMLTEAHRSAARTEAGGARLSGTIGALSELDEAFRRAGSH